MKRGTAELGKVYQDEVSGFQGRAMAVTDYLYACRRVTLSALNTQNEVVEFTFDEPQLHEVVGEERLWSVDRSEPLEQTGGARDTVRRPRHGTR